MPQVPDALVTVESADSSRELRRFAEIPYVLLHDQDNWSLGVRAFEQWRLDVRRHPYFDRGDAAFFLARRAGRPVGRIAAHVDGSPGAQGWFGFFDVPDDSTVTRALVEAAVDWLRAKGATSMTGPVSWTADEDFGLLVSGHRRRAATGLAWHPRWYARQLAAVGAVPGTRRETFELLTSSTSADQPPPTDDDPPPQAGAYGDPALVLDGIAAVPDVSGLLSGATVRDAWKLARAVRHRTFDTAVCVRCDGDPAVLVPGLLAACRAAGYERLLAPWAPDGRPPDRIHQVFTMDWS